MLGKAGGGPCESAAEPRTTRARRDADKGCETFSARAGVGPQRARNRRRTRGRAPVSPARGRRARGIPRARDRSRSPGAVGAPRAGRTSLSVGSDLVPESDILGCAGALEASRCPGSSKSLALLRRDGWFSPAHGPATTVRHRFAAQNEATPRAGTARPAATRNRRPRARRPRPAADADARAPRARGPARAPAPALVAACTLAAARAHARFPAMRVAVVGAARRAQMARDNFPHAGAAWASRRAARAPLRSHDAATPRSRRPAAAAAAAARPSRATRCARGSAGGTARTTCGSRPSATGPRACASTRACPRRGRSARGSSSPPRRAAPPAAAGASGRGAARAFVAALRGRRRAAARAARARPHVHAWSARDLSGPRAGMKLRPSLSLSGRSSSRSTASRSTSRAAAAASAARLGELLSPAPAGPDPHVRRPRDTRARSRERGRG